jgi:hypothetical protein
MEMKAKRITTAEEIVTCDAQVIPLFGRDEMNLVEFPFGPVTQSATKTMEIEHDVFDKSLKREVTRRLVITGSDAFGLPRPIDDQVLIGMKALSHEAGYVSRTVKFSRYQLCRAIGWEPDGRAYQRLEESFDRIAGTTLKFKDAWWDKGDHVWRSKTFHLIEEVNLCSRDELDRNRQRGTFSGNRLCSFVWSEVIWKSFQDGFIKSLDMKMFRRIASGRRREVPLRLFRILDKRFHYGNVAQLKLERLCVGTLGLSPSYTPSQMIRVLERATEWLVKCGFLSGMKTGQGRLSRSSEVFFLKAITTRRQRRSGTTAAAVPSVVPSRATDDHHRTWLHSQNEAALLLAEEHALAAGFGTDLERKLVAEARSRGTGVFASGRIRTQYIERFVRSRSSE